METLGAKYDGLVCDGGLMHIMDRCCDLGFAMVA